MTTQNPAAVADTDALTVRRSIRIAAPRAKVWQAVTEPAHISRWFAPTALEGGDGTISFPDYGAVPLRVIESEPGRSITYRWNNDDSLGAVPQAFDEATATTFTFTLADAPGGTELTVLETGFERTADPAFNVTCHGDGWTSELDKLVALLEDGVELAGAAA